MAGLWLWLRLWLRLRLRLWLRLWLWLGSVAPLLCRQDATHYSLLTDMMLLMSKLVASNGPMSSAMLLIKGVMSGLSWIGMMPIIMIIVPCSE
jgi:hypothetical protein